MRIKPIVTFLFALISLLSAAVHAAEQPWISLFDGKTTEGWSVRGGTAEVVDGELRLGGKADIYRMDVKHPGRFDEFDFMTEARTEPGAKAAICFESMLNLPRDIRVAIDNSRDWTDRAPRTGSLGEVRHEYKSIVRDGEWFKLRILHHGYDSSVWVNNVLLERGTFRMGGNLTIRLGASPAKVCFKNMRIQRLPRTVNAPLTGSEPAPDADAVAIRLGELAKAEFPLINYHIHLKGDLTLEKALAHSRETGVFYGIAANCGLNFPITNDQGINDYIKKLEGQPCFIGMQAEGREWPTLFSKAGHRQVRLYLHRRHDDRRSSRQAGRGSGCPTKSISPTSRPSWNCSCGRSNRSSTTSRSTSTPTRPTCPTCSIKEYDALWTPERVKRVIDAAARNGVAIEISNRLKLPKADFIRQAKQAGVKFTRRHEQRRLEARPRGICLADDPRVRAASPATCSCPSPTERSRSRCGDSRPKPKKRFDRKMVGQKNRERKKEH